MFMKTAGRELDWKKGYRGSDVKYGRVFIRTDGKLLEPMNYRRQKTSISNLVQMDIFKILSMEQTPMMQSS
jgi:hypothetical protein